MKTTNKYLQNFFKSKLVRFAITGGSGLVLDMYITWLLKEKFSFDQYMAHAIGFLVAVINNYLINKYWTFKDAKKGSLRQFLLFLIISIVGLCLNTSFLYVFVTFLRVNFYLAKILSVILIFLWNYMSNSFLTFRASRQNRLVTMK